MDAQRIKDLRLQLKLTQKEFAKKTGISYQTISALENGLSIPDGKTPLYEAIFEKLERELQPDLIAEEKPKYQKTEIMDVILEEVREMRKENSEMREMYIKEVKLNTLLRAQFRIAMDILETLSEEVDTNAKKSTGTKHRVG